MDNSFPLQNSSLVNILTLRYDPLLKPNLPKKTSNDFEINNNIPNTEFIEKTICENIEQNLKFSNEEKISIALSGGVDSTLALSLVRKVKPNIEIEAISIKFADSVDETIAASKIAHKFNVNHSIIYLENYLSELPKAISMIKLPFWDLHWYYVVKKAKTFSNILISGDGGDELFSGYTFRYEKFLSITSKNSTPLEKVKAYLECHERDRVPDQENIFAEKSNFSWNSIYDILIPYFDNNLSRLDQVYLADYNGKLLYNFNPINSRIINYFQMKLITPIINEKLIKLSSHIPSKLKYDEINNIGKLPLRKILQKNGHDSLVNNKKLGFNVNTVNLWKSHGYNLCKNYLIDSRAVKDGWINSDWIQKHIGDPDLNVKYINKFFGLLAFEIWYRLFVTKEMNSNTKLN
ncbi:asparagine synthase C-terminal domain-containing protein [Nitrosopumilus sp.]|nr:asparagine synthase C-terminal domain-containing protein [Nitrosopumilus sp.]